MQTVDGSVNSDMIILKQDADDWIVVTVEDAVVDEAHFSSEDEARSFVDEQETRLGLGPDPDDP